MKDANGTMPRRREAGDGGAEATRYWWWKAPEDLFGHHEIMVLKAMRNGREMAEEYCEICCKAVSRGGYLRFSKEKPYSRATLGSIIGLSGADSGKLCKALESVDLLEWLGDGTAHLIGLEDLIGSETESARRMRESRKKSTDPNGAKCAQCDKKSDIPVTKCAQSDGKNATMCAHCDPSSLGESLCPESLEGRNTPSLRDSVLRPDDEEAKDEGCKGALPPTPDGSPDGLMAEEDGKEPKCLGDAKGPRISAAMAEDFWKAYPKKANLGAVRRWFENAEPTLSEFKSMIKALEASKGSEDWKKGGGRFIPLPISWLEGERWRDRAAAPLKGYEPSVAAFEADVRATVAIAKRVFGL